MSVKSFMDASRRQRQFLVVILVGCVCSAWLWLSYSYGVGGKGSTFGNKAVILMWTTYYERKGDYLMHLILRGRKWDKSCCDEQVEITLDRNQLDRATAIVFYGYVANLHKNDLPKTRRPDQLWILFGKESPYLSPPLSSYNGLFNWTMTYRTDSEIWAPYGKAVLDEVVSEENIEINGVPLDQWISRKTALLTGVISHCPTQSKREEYIQLLKKVIPVDIYGNCGTISICPRINAKCDHAAWWKDLGSKYKFYFAAENAFCVDYITEKFWRSLQLGMVPVVYGGGNYTKEAPPNSYIDVRDFSSHQELAQRLVYLNGNADEYRKYFTWRSKYKIRMDESWQGWCDLCKAVLEFRRVLKENDHPNTLAALSHVYSDLRRWWWFKPYPENWKRACSKPDFK